ncbi:MAG: hypothetical protein SF182_25645 [Deltaproteobacteria bacterium]|nr:hypothetical protein [Deltaproteobacteria bacterium]
MANKTHAWIYDTVGTHDGWLEIREEDGELRPADVAWKRIASFPAEPEAGRPTRLVLWADQRDKYIARLDIGEVQRWVICEQLPALLRALPSFEALFRLGGGR